MKYFLTGGCGFIGTHLARQLLTDGHEVFIADNFVVGSRARLRDAEKLEIVEADIRDSRQIRDLFISKKPDRVVHLAAHHYIPYCDEHPLETMEVNTQGTDSVLGAAIAAGVKAVLFASSAAVYEPIDGPCDEGSSLGPIDIYGYSKWMGELLCERYASELKINIAIARIFNVFGPEETNSHVIPHILSQISGKGEVRLGNLHTKRDFIYVDDVVDALTLLSENPPEGCSVYNVGTGVAYSINKLVDVISSCLDYPIEVHSNEELRREVDRPVLLCNPERIHVQAGWTPKHSLEAGLKKLLSAEGLM